MESWRGSKGTDTYEIGSQYQLLRCGAKNRNCRTLGKVGGPPPLGVAREGNQEGVVRDFPGGLWLRLHASTPGAWV